ncbi:uncharacterized protein G2W53_041560 [Senna tora]|uniref:Uncharacterized protein n=1 Tax=Senna tora TaxID=362788 RepID=A0A834SFC7_9FABA|nr:uncharacterized protein G2W53_041560 [Senna tora]
MDEKNERKRKWRECSRMGRNVYPKLPRRSLMLRDFWDIRLKLFPGKLKSRWSGPFLVTKVAPYGAVEVKDEKTSNVFLTNGQRLKHYWGGGFERANFVVIFEPP